ncbi:MAG: cell division protein FtsQ/DivIB [Candidatus Moranbacteria bacterium]|nr:cell division protein FtsQ/DivIB [Candidatus Moranbacteria bacterium]
MLRKKKNRKIKKRSFFLGFNFKKILVRVLFLAFLSVSVWTIFFSDYARIENAVVHSPEMDKKKIKDKTEEFLRGRKLSFLPRGNIILISADRLESFLKEEFYVIKKVEIEKKFPGKIILKAEPRGSIAIWQAGEEYFLVDSGGEVFKKAKKEELNNGKINNFLIIKEKKSAAVEEGERMKAGSMIDFAYQSKKWLEKELNVKIDREMQTPSRVSKELRVKTDQGWEVYFNIGQTAQSQVNLLKKLLEERIEPEERENLNYIDLRVKGKAIYK